MIRRGTTLVELLLVVAIMSFVLGAIAMLFGYSITRASYAAADYFAIEQAMQVADRIEGTIRNATACSWQNGGGNATGGLKCIMPLNGTDTDGDGYFDTYTAAGVSRRGAPKYGSGKRVWFYFANSTGAWANNGSIFWRAQRGDDSYPLAGDGDLKTAYLQDGATLRFPMVVTMSAVLNDVPQTVVLTVTASALTRKYASASGTGSNEAFTVTRTIKWKNWRK